MPTCTASTSSSPTSPTCARTPTASRRCVATHGHEDHVGGLSYLLRDLSFPIYGSPLTLGLARNRIEEAGLLGRTELVPVADGERRQIGPFDVEFIPVTHSVPHAFAIALHTPQGVILHSGDFKLDLTPVDRRRHRPRPHRRDRLRRRASGCCCPTPPTPRRPGTHRARPPWARCCRRCSRQHDGRRIITASFASHIHRIQQIADAAIYHGRKVATLGLSMRKNVRLAPRPRPAQHPRCVARRHRGRRRPAAGQGVRHLHRFPGRADVGAVAAGPGREPLAEGHARRHGHPARATPSPATSSTSTG